MKKVDIGFSLDKCQQFSFLYILPNLRLQFFSVIKPTMSKNSTVLHCKITVKNKADYFADFTYRGLFLERIPAINEGSLYMKHNVAVAQGDYRDDHTVF